jgi:hypothetical protein
MNYFEPWKEIIRPKLDEAFRIHGGTTNSTTLLAYRVWHDGSLESPSRFEVPEANEHAKAAVLDAFAITLRDVNPDKTKVDFRFEWV